LTVGGVTRPRRAHEEATAPPVCLVVVIVIIIIIVIVVVAALVVIVIVVVIVSKPALATGLDGLGRYNRTDDRCGKQNHRKTGEQCHKS
jgi:flagellar basal body-associated protein FliL